MERTSNSKSSENHVKSFVIGITTVCMIIKNEINNLLKKQNSSDKTIKKINKILKSTNDILDHLLESQKCCRKIKLTTNAFFTLLSQMLI